MVLLQNPVFCLFDSYPFKMVSAEQSSTECKTKTLKRTRSIVAVNILENSLELKLLIEMNYSASRTFLVINCCSFCSNSQWNLSYRF